MPGRASVGLASQHRPFSPTILGRVSAVRHLEVQRQPGCLLEARGFASPPRDGFAFVVGPSRRVARRRTFALTHYICRRPEEKYTPWGERGRKVRLRRAVMGSARSTKPPHDDPRRTQKTRRSKNEPIISATLSLQAGA